MKLLTRSFAIMESTSPPPDRSLSPVNCPSSLISSTENLAITNNNNNSVTINNNSNGSLENSQEQSNQGSENNSSANISLGRFTLINIVCCFFLNVIKIFHFN